MPLGDCGGMFTADGEQARRHLLSPSVKGPAVDASLDPISWGRRSWSEFKSTKWEVTANMCRVSFGGDHSVLKLIMVIIA